LRQLGDLGGEDFRFTRGAQPPLDPLEELEAELRLGMRQHFAGRRLRNMQDLGGFGQRARTADGFEDLDVAQAHGENPDRGNSSSL